MQYIIVETLTLKVISLMRWFIRTRRYVTSPLS